jgi:2-desacetyl-2-hydroxyethyl bacteriochlorophyllide A dehydrogenase
MKTRQAVYFTGPRRLEVRQEACPATAPDELLVATHATAISAGTELLLYRGQAPSDLPADATLASLPGTLAFPRKYGYAAVGQVIEAGEAADASWIGRQVFAFHPHETYFTARPADLLPLPPDLPPEHALWLPSLETAINLVQDARPILGERVVVFGLGIVGLLTTALLCRMPLARLVVVDRHAWRRRTALHLGAHAALDPALPHLSDELRAALDNPSGQGADLVLEVSGDPSALQSALEICGYAARVVIGSWYGTKRADLDLGGLFHRNRITLTSSQVSTIAPRLAGRWDKPRRMALALDLLRTLEIEAWVTHRFDMAQAAEAFDLLDQRPEETLQVILRCSP